jgi:integrase/recombinase XerD
MSIMKEPANRLGPLLQNFFVDYLCTQKRASSQTIVSYRDTFRLLLEFVRDKHGIEPAAACVVDLDVPILLSFLDHLEQTRHNSIRSRNLRLAAIRSFFRVVALRDPASVNQAARVLAIPVKRADRQIVKALSRTEMEAILAAPDLKQWSGRRDHALLLTLYNSGARVSEITALEKSQFRFGVNSFLHLHGKGRKERTVPLWTKTARALQSWFRELSPQQTDLAFPSARGRRLTRNGVDYILQQAVDRAVAGCPSLHDKKITPHSVRHTTATHLLQSGVDISVIALWLGHESIETTHIYLEADLTTKERALSKLAPAGVEVPRFKAKDEVLAFLATL